MKRWGLAILLLLSLGVNLGILATLALRRASEPPPERPAPASGVRPWEGQRPRVAMEKIVRRLGLEGEDQRRFVELQRTFFLNRQKVQRRSREIQRDMRQELTSEDPDGQRVEELIRESGKVHAEGERLVAEVVLETRKLLQPSQERDYLSFLAFIMRSSLRQGGAGRNPGLRPGGFRGSRPQGASPGRAREGPPVIEARPRNPNLPPGTGVSP